MAIYLVKFQPLNFSRKGQQAAAQFNIRPYVDGSCRREPDLECKFPSISALCRGKLFAPKLKEGDEVVYITKKSRYEEKFRHWRIVAHLKVFKRFNTHPDAAVWYLEEIGELPKNCMVAGNRPLSLNRTSYSTQNCVPGCGSTATTLKKWNEHYKKRAAAIRVFFACKTVRKELTSPAILTDQAAFKILKSKKRVNARNPIEITHTELKALVRLMMTRNNLKIRTSK